MLRSRATDGPVVAVNGRFLTMTATGVQRYAHEILRQLRAHLEAELRVIVPPNRVLEGDDPEVGEIVVTGRWHGVRGHLWEQLTLPRLARRAGARALWSPCSWGPIAVRRQVPVIHDIAPLIHPEFFTPAYRPLPRVLTGPLVRRSALVVTPSTRVRGDLIERFGLDPDGVITIPPGVGPPFNRWPIDDLERRTGRYCLIVGATDSRKNAEFLLELWPEVHARTGLELHLTYRRIVTTRRLHALEAAPTAGIVTHTDPTDEELASLYANALCLLWPSHYEGYGLPLLEAMAVGTPFLSTDVGASAELAVAPEEQILPLEPERWIERLEAWHSTGLGRLREASARRARAQSWDAAAKQTARVLDQLARST
jgi:glycosyltransferase involved in cell wall biosynthesis